MPTHVHTTQSYPHPADFVWRFLSDFFSPWHPYISWCERADDRTRRFGMPGEDTVYIEQLTNVDHDGHRFTYTMLQGIDGIDGYRGTAYVESLSPNRSQVIWEAEISGPTAITARVATGTEAVFNAGLDELARILAAMTVQTAFIDGEPRLAVDVAGQGELLLFLHGIGGNRTNWHPQLDAFAPQFTCAALDFRGYGRSELGGDEVNAHVLIDDILQVLNHFAAEKVHLVGLSYGSWIAASFAHCYPARIRSVTLCSGSTGMTLADDVARTRFKQLRFDPIAAGQTPADIAPAVVAAISGPNASAENKQTLLASMQAIPRATYLAALNCFLAPPFQIAFEQFAFPTLFMAGEHDQLASPAEMSGVAVRVSGSQFVMIEGTGHLSNLECPNQFNAQLGTFLAAQHADTRA